MEILGDCPTDEYPLQKKKMSMEYLRTMPTLRPRHQHLQRRIPRAQRGCLRHPQVLPGEWLHLLPLSLLTASDCEGAGEMFQVTTLDLQNVPKNEDGTVDYSQDFFEKPVNLTVSGQLEAEAMAMAFGKDLLFGDVGVMLADFGFCGRGDDGFRVISGFPSFPSGNFTPQISRHTALVGTPCAATEVTAYNHFYGESFTHHTYRHHRIGCSHFPVGADVGCGIQEFLLQSGSTFVL